MNSRLHIYTWQVNKGAKGPQDNAYFEFDESEFRRKISSVRKGQFFTAHLIWDPGITKVCQSEGIPVVHLIRDPRDVLVSRLHYAKGLKRTRLNRTLMERYPDDETRLRALITGDETNEAKGYINLASMAHSWSRFQGWLSDPNSMVVRFEDLVGSAGGGSDNKRAETITAVLQHVGLSYRPEIVNKMMQRSSGKGSLTFRRGKVGAWQDEIPVGAQHTLAECMGQQLEQMGYREAIPGDVSH